MDWTVIHVPTALISGALGALGAYLVNRVMRRADAERLENGAFPNGYRGLILKELLSMNTLITTLMQSIGELERRHLEFDERIQRLEK